jgi:hypothetical protein
MLTIDRWKTKFGGQLSALAHLYQLLVVGQVPVILFFVFRWLRRALIQGLRVVVAQVFALAAALVPVHMMGW